MYFKINEVYKTLTIMSYQSKIRISIGWIYPIGVLTSYIIALVEIVIREYLIKKGYEIIITPYFAISLVGLFFIVFGVIQWFRYKNWIYPILGILMGVTTFFASFSFSGHSAIFKAIYLVCFIVTILFVVINWQSFYCHERFEINSRRLFRLASERICQTSEGFTERLYSAGKVECGKDELLGFARILHSYYVARPFYYENYIALAFSMNTSILAIKEVTEVSHIILDYNGNIRVKISEKDYRDYKERLSFDQLCSSMANIFIRFLDYYQKGLESRIVTELKSAK